MVVTALLSLSGITPPAFAEKEATLQDQLIVKDPGPSALVGPTQAIFFPPMLKWESWDYSPMWADKPKAISKSLPQNWKTKVRFDNAYGRSRAIIDLPPGTDLYGQGLVSGALRRNNSKIAIWNTDNYEYGTDNARRLYQGHPWVMGVRTDGSAFGVLADTTWRSTIETSDNEIIFDSEGPVFPVLVIEGKTPQEVLRQLAERTGHTPMPPLWSLGYQQCRFSYESDVKGLGIAKEFRKRQIPADVIWMDIDYMEGYRVFTFNKKGFPNPKEYSDALHDLNFKGVWMIDPGVKNDPDYFVLKSGDAQDVWVKKSDQKTDFIGPVWPGDCKFPDFTREETRTWWSGLYQDFIKNNGIDGIWNDMNEPAVFQTPGHTMPVDNFHRGDKNIQPGPHLKYHNIYGLLMLASTRKGMEEAHPDKRPFLLSRANFMGGQRYGATWTGDNSSSENHMRMSIPMTLSLGLSGQPFNGPDLGGFGGNATKEMYEQWISFGSFFPFCRNHACKGTQQKEPWAYGPEAEQVAKTAIERRYRLLPFMYTQFWRSTQDGRPFMQPTFFADPSDKSLRGEESTFLIGGDLLVIPTIAQNPALPKGEWLPVNLLENKADSNAKQATVKIRPGAIIPLGEVVQHTGEPMLDTTTLVINLDENGKASGELYQDAGDGYGFLNGDYCLTAYTAERTSEGVVIKTEIKEGKRPTATKKIVARLLTSDGEQRAEGSPGQPLRISGVSSKTME